MMVLLFGLTASLHLAAFAMKMAVDIPWPMLRSQDGLAARNWTASEAAQALHRRTSRHPRNAGDRPNPCACLRTAMDRLIAAETS